MKAHDPLVERIKKEVKMGNENEANQEQRVAQALGKLDERMGKLEENQKSLAQSSTESSTDKQPEEIEQLRSKVAELEQAEPSLKRQGAEELVRSFEANEIKDGELAQRVFGAIRGAGYTIQLQGEPAAVEEKQKAAVEEETPEPPYLLIIDQEELESRSDKADFFTYGPGKFARLVEAV